MADRDSLSYHCECNCGWKTLMVAPMPYPSCIVPNCSMNIPCGKKAPPPPPPPSPSPSPFNITNRCNFVWCGDGECVANGAKHHCRCHNDADNLFNNTSLICMKQCSFNADCNHLGINVISPSPPPSSTGSLCCGKNKVAYTELSLIVVIFAATIIVMT
ncbi:uncharacterized protein [Rutidosis leptorrhynchoides]|uniref:uncharacterized protein n=1 Tax=Rutidosis leptorrhynchoides TaxID=125765 RepID=UPI003A99FB53